MEKEILLKIAKEAIRTKFTNTTLDIEKLKELYPQLREKGAVFVTLNLNGNLRGCIGSLVAHRPLIDDLIHNARAAAFEDPRFPPLSEDEFKNVHIEVSLLSSPKELFYEDIDDLKSKIRPNIDGVILTYGYNRATFLPQVWEQLPTFDLFFSHLCQKAGLQPDCLENHPQILTYQVTKIE